MTPRLKKRRDFVALQKSAAKGIAKTVVIQARPAEDTIRVGFTASKKQIGNAVQRNRAKRRLRAAVEDALKSQAIAPHDLSLIARQDVLTRDYKLLVKDIVYCLKKAGVVEAGRKMLDAGKQP